MDPRRKFTPQRGGWEEIAFMFIVMDMQTCTTLWKGNWVMFKILNIKTILNVMPLTLQTCF